MAAYECRACGAFFSFLCLSWLRVRVRLPTSMRRFSMLELTLQWKSSMPLEPQVIGTQKDGGITVITSNAQIEDVTALTVSMPIKLKDFRIRLMDWQDKIVVSDDELLADGKTYLVTPSEPLKSGRNYTLTLDADLGLVITDETGGTWNDWELSFHMTGDVVPEPSARKPGKKKK
jgi:hypothetical protein